MGCSSPKSVPSPITTLKAEQVEDMEMATMVGTEATATSIPTATATTWDLTLGLAPTPDPTIA